MMTCNWPRRRFVWMSALRMARLFTKAHSTAGRLEFTTTLQREVEEAAHAIHELLASGHLPPPINNQRCPECSLKNICLPGVVVEKERGRRAALELFVV